MGVILNVWRTSPGNVGHVSLEVNGTYMSYWPSDPAGKKDVKVGQTHAAAFPSSYAVDRRIEQCDCDVRRMLVRVDARPVLEAWQRFKANPARYNMVEHNCSTVIAMLLEIGSGVPPGFVPRVAVDDHASGWAERVLFRLRFLSGSIDMWTPNTVLQYADQIEQGSLR
jgi:hypothetical protein